MGLCPGCNVRLPARATGCPHCGKTFNRRPRGILRGRERVGGKGNTVGLVLALIAAVVIVIIVWASFGQTDRELRERREEQEKTLKQGR